MEQSPEPKSPGRRKFLRCAAAGAGFVAAASLGGCSLFDEPEMRIGSVAELEAEGFLSPKFNRDRIFTTYLDGKLTTFSLICSHKKCTVKWAENDQEFQCPCHDGRYDKEGFVIDGPPPGPLKRFKTEIRGQDVWVLNQLEE